jgi:hypothetical protein
LVPEKVIRASQITADHHEQKQHEWYGHMVSVHLKPPFFEML